MSRIASIRPSIQPHIQRQHFWRPIQVRPWSNRSTLGRRRFCTKANPTIAHTKKRQPNLRRNFNGYGYSPKHQKELDLYPNRINPNRIKFENEKHHMQIDEVIQKLKQANRKIKELENYIGNECNYDE